MIDNPRILIAGSTGYLGRHIVEQLLKNKADFIALARNKNKLLSIGVQEDKIIAGNITSPTDLQGICDGVDVVISCVGITRQKDGFSYRDVDYQANLNLLQEAERAGVTKSPHLMHNVTHRSVYWQLKRSLHNVY